MTMPDSWVEALGSKPVRRLKNLLTVGNLWLYILSLIRAHGRAYAYNMDEEIEKEFFFRPSKALIYIVLYKLESEKLIMSKFEERRKYYTMTKTGEHALNAARDYFKALSGKL